MDMRIDQKSVTNRVFNALLVVTMFSITGFLLPPLVSRLIPTSYYYDVVVPSEVNADVYKPGDVVTIYLERSSRISQAAEETLELSLVQTDSDEDINSERRYINIETGQRVIRVRYQIPQGIVSGSYVVRGNIFFRVEGTPRNVNFFTEEFLVDAN